MSLEPVELIVVGASAGGLDALAGLLARLPASMPPIAIVQHRAIDEHSRLAELLQGHTTLSVCEPDDKEPLVAGRVYVAPADYHLLIEARRLALSTEAPVSYSRPSIDVLFETAARAYGARLVAVVLTASSEDGVEGAETVRRCGGRVCVQDPASAASPCLPAAVIARGAADRVLPLDEIPAWLVSACAAGPGPR